MLLKEQQIKGVWLVKANPIIDSRGSFRRHFCQNEFKQVCLQMNIAQTNISENHKKHTLRGFHYQLAPHEENKVLACLHGAIYDVIIGKAKLQEVVQETDLEFLNIAPSSAQ